MLTTLGSRLVALAQGEPIPGVIAQQDVPGRAGFELARVCHPEQNALRRHSHPAQAPLPDAAAIPRPIAGRPYTREQ